MARDLGVAVEFSPDEFHYLIPDLQADRFDLIVSGMSITTNRAMQVNFSRPYNFVDLTFVANKQLAGNMKTLADFNQPQVTIGVLDTSTAVDIASNAFPNADLRTYPKAPTFSPTCSMANSTAQSPIARARKLSPSCIPIT